MSVIAETLGKQRTIFDFITIYNQAQNSRHETYDGPQTQGAYHAGYDRTRSTRGDYRGYARPRVEPQYRSRYTSGYNPQYRAGEDLPYVPNPTPGPQFQLSPTDPGGYRDLLLQDCCDLIDKRLQDFDGMSRKATDLETWVSLQSINFPSSLSSIFPLEKNHTSIFLVR